MSDNSGAMNRMADDDPAVLAAMAELEWLWRRLRPRQPPTRHFASKIHLRPLRGLYAGKRL
jgi:hypothetical protein